MLKFFLVALVLLIPCQAFAESYVWFTGTVKRVYPLNNGNFIIIFNENSALCTSRPSDQYHNVTVGQANVTAEGLKAMLSTTTTAGVTGKKLMINFDKDSASCFVNRMQLIFKE